MKITDQLYMLQLPVEMPHPSFLHPSVIKDKNFLVLVDTGLEGPEYLGKIMDLFQQDDLSFDELETIILTHQDFDHIGGLHGILESFDKTIEVYFHEAEKSYIVGDQELIKGAKKKMPSLFKLLRRKMEGEKQSEYEDGSDIKVIRMLKDGDLLPIGGGVRVIHTPGHTPGNICLYHYNSRTLIAGDTFNFLDGKLIGPNPVYTPNMDQAMTSLEKLLEYDIARIICYHGGLYEDHPNEKIRQIIDSYKNKE
ncbi:MBL fold metallo-hydrolase [Alkalibacter rhizosphaerae]|uniref:MBL fold metallo-hydrolase n=1 Tax=Alkalibacter rhizosphaerae TaxID=2815577 RepID=A0A974XMG9_9FIRM|nr:MBL fold metallo-hydrolase [Alkalibacter rhizosphaerae]QSX08626.1 MBL fold metallo-hydrolase [Alkalibacter rhizosphaerae]